MNRRSFILDSAIAVILAGIEARGEHSAWSSEPNFPGPGISFDIDDLPLLRKGVQTHQFCSYDRAGDNYDWDYFPLYTEPDGEVVLFDAIGPGCLYRHHMNIWRGWPRPQAGVDTKGVKIRYYFDDEERPRIDMDVSTFFSSKNPLGIFRPPVAVDGRNDFKIMYCPMYFTRRLKITLSREPGGPGSEEKPWAGRYDKIPKRRNHWYNFTFHTFTQDLGIPSWAPGQQETALVSLWDPKKLRQDPKPTEGIEEKDCFLTVPAGEQVSLMEINGGGSISSLRIMIEPLNEETLFQTWLKITWDKYSPAQVEAPLGAFFGANRTVLKAGFSSLLLGYSPSSMYCYFPMPFWESAKIELDNRGSQATNVVGGSVRYKSSDAHAYPETQCGYFFAHYRKEFPRKEGTDFKYLQWHGRGHVVGHVTSRFDTSMEENERTYFDDSRTPQIEGEGFEDDHGMGWGLKNLQCAVFGAFAANGGSGTAYRFFSPDLYFFQSAINHGHQVYGPHSPLGHEGMYKVGDEESVTFFYGRECPGLTLTDELDIGKHASESEHAYQVAGTRKDKKGSFWYDGEFNNVLSKASPVEDDGVSFNGYSQFRVKIDPANRGVRIRRRTDKENNRQRANVYVDDNLITERPWYTVDYEKTYRNIRWPDSDFEIPAKYTEGKNSVTLKIEYVSGKNREWDEYYYWIYSYK